MYRKDIKKIYKSIGKLAKNANKKLKDELRKKLILIEENPYLYQSFETNPNIRRFFVQKYVVFYKVEGKNIRVIRILFQKANYNQRVIDKTKSKKELEFNSRK